MVRVLLKLDTMDILISSLNETIRCIYGQRSQEKGREALSAPGWGCQGGLLGGSEAKAEECKLLKLVVESSYLF